MCDPITQLGTLIARFKQWSLDHVMNILQVRLHCSTRVLHPSGTICTYWATETSYPYTPGSRRDFVEIDLGRGRIGMGQLIAFIDMDHLPPDQPGPRAHVVLIRWLSVSSQSRETDEHSRPLCEYPLCVNHCLWEWSNSGRNRECFRQRGFRRMVNRQKIWSHVPDAQRQQCIDSEIRARYDVIQYSSILRHANVTEDVDTGQMVQTLQMI